uniref:Uncharacterized protein n=2 Tax=Aegilops tauschii subsp. strangulata TaxID=200361 RepID=A0A453KSB2_AEGTS
MHDVLWYMSSVRVSKARKFYCWHTPTEHRSKKPRHLVLALGTARGRNCSSTAPVHSPLSLSMHSSGSPTSQHIVAGGPSSQLLYGLQRREIARSSTCETVHVHAPAPPGKLQ